jgi:hypothetical protein
MPTQRGPRRFGGNDNHHEAVIMELKYESTAQLTAGLPDALRCHVGDCCRARTNAVMSGLYGTPWRLLASKHKRIRAGVLLLGPAGTIFYTQ